MNHFGKLACVALIGSAAAAHAQIVDQQDLNNNAYMAQFGQTDLAQSFQQSVNDIDGAAIYLNAGTSDGANTTITIQLYDALPNAGGNLLASGSVNLAGDNQWASVSWADTAITANTTYYLVFQSTDLSYGIAGDINNGYSRGQVYANPGFGSFPGYDYTFQTFRAPAVPEPVSCSLLGFGALALIRRRRANKA